MELSYCGADCKRCGYGKNEGCKGCRRSGGCPFGKRCFIADYIQKGGMAQFEAFKKMLMYEFNKLGIEGMPEITDLQPMNGEYVNLAYPMPSGERVKLLHDKDIYLCTQVECLFNDGEVGRCFGLAANMEMIMVSEYGPNGSDPVLLAYKKW